MSSDGRRPSHGGFRSSPFSLFGGSTSTGMSVSIIMLSKTPCFTDSLTRGHRHGPPGAKPLSRLLSKSLTTWQTVVITMMYLYAARNFSALLGLASPEPMANMYDPTFFRATWVLTALDAGFWTAMRIRAKWLRDLASIAFSVFYLFAAERADE